MPDVLTGLLSSAGQTAAIFGLGHLCRRFGIFTPRHMEGINKFIATIALPAIFFFALATLDPENLSLGLLGSISLGKILVYIGTCAVTWIGCNDLQKRPGITGIYGIFATQSNDIALGLPIVVATFGAEYGTYVFLLAPVQLLVINLCSLILMEIQGQKNKEAEAMVNGGDDDDKTADSEGQASPAHLAWIILKKLAQSPIIMSCVLGLVANQALGPKGIPLFFRGIFRTLGVTFGGTALFSLGLAIDPEMKGGETTTIGILVATKVILMPLVLAIVTRIITESEVDTQFAFIYGMLPTAPTAYILAVAYRIKQETMSSAVLIVLIASLPMLLIGGAALQAQSEEDVENSNRVSLRIATWVAGLSLACCAIFLLLCYLARQTRPIKGAWRVLMSLAAVTIALDTVKLSCISNSGKEIQPSQAVGLHLWEVGLQTLQSGYGLVLSFVLCTKLTDSVENVLKVEKWGHAIVWGGTLVISLIYVIPGIVPEYRELNNSDGNYAQSVLQCTTWDPIAFKVIKLLVDVSISFASVWLVMRFQNAVNQGRFVEAASDVEFSGASGNDKAKKLLASSSDAELKANYTIMDDNTGIVQSEFEANDASDFQEEKRDSSALSQIGEDAKISGSGFATGTGESKSPVTESEMSKDSARYTAGVFYVTAGVTLGMIMSISDLAKTADDAPAYTQVLFVLYVVFRQSLGVLILVLWFWNKDLQRGLQECYNVIVRNVPCIETARIAVSAYFIGLDLMPGVASTDRVVISATEGSNDIRAINSVTGIRKRTDRLGVVAAKLGVFY